MPLAASATKPLARRQPLFMTSPFPRTRAVSFPCQNGATTSPRNLHARPGRTFEPRKANKPGDRSRSPFLVTGQLLPNRPPEAGHPSGRPGSKNWGRAAAPRPAGGESPEGRSCPKKAKRCSGCRPQTDQRDRQSWGTPEVVSNRDGAVERHGGDFQRQQAGTRQSHSV